MMNSKLAVCALFLIIGSSNAENPTVEEHYQPKYRNYDGPVIHEHDEHHPSQICAKSAEGSYWANINDFDHVCSSNIVCRPPWPKQDVVLGVVPETGVACDGPGRHACIGGKCTYLVFEDVAAQRDLEARPRKVYKEYDGEVILSNNAEHPLQLCAKALNDAGVSWSNEGSEDACSGYIKCYVPSKLQEVTLQKRPPNGVPLGPAGRKICENGAIKNVEYYVPEPSRNAHRLGYRTRLSSTKYF